MFKYAMHYIKYRRLFDSTEQFKRYYTIYNDRTKGFVADITIPYQDGITANSIGVETYVVPAIPGRLDEIYRLVGAEKFTGKRGYNVQYEFEGFKHVKPIRACTFVEFCLFYRGQIAES